MMLVIRNHQDLNALRKQVERAIHSSLELDVDVLETQFNDYANDKSRIVLINENELGTLHMRYPIIDSTIPEDDELIYQDGDEVIVRRCYIIGESGFIIYIRKGRRYV